MGFYGLVIWSMEGWWQKEKSSRVGDSRQQRE